MPDQSSRGQVQRLGYVACSRMYDATASVRTMWHELFTWLGRRAGVDLVAIDHAAPLPLEHLWDRPDLGVTFMCGYPFATRPEPVMLLCAPIPKGGGFDGTPRYRSLFVTPAGSRFRQLPESFDGTIGWNAMHSYSGYQAPRHYLSDHSSYGAPLFRASVGPFGTPRATLEALLDGRADVCAVDSYLFALLLRHDAEFAACFRVIGETDLVPIPPLIAASPVPAAHVCALRQSLLSADKTPELRSLLDALSLERFAPVEPEIYDELPRRSQEADARAYMRLV